MINIRMARCGNLGVNEGAAASQVMEEHMHDLWKESSAVWWCVHIMLALYKKHPITLHINLGQAKVRYMYILHK